MYEETSTESSMLVKQRPMTTDDYNFTIPQTKQCLSGAQTYTLPLFCDRDNWSYDLETQRWPRYSEDVSTIWNCYVKPFARYSLNWKSTKIAFKVKCQGHYVTNFEPLLVFTMGHIPTKFDQFLTSSFQDFVQTDTDRRTDWLIDWAEV